MGREWRRAFAGWFSPADAAANKLPDTLVRATAFGSAADPPVEHHFGFDALTGVWGTFTYAGHNWPLVNSIQTNRVQLTERGHVTKLVTYFYNDGAGPLTIPTQHCRAVIFADDGQTIGGYVPGNIGVIPGTFLRGGPEATGFTRQAWNDIPLDSPIDLEPGYYWIGICSDNSADGLTIDAFNRYRSYTYQSTGSFPAYFDVGDSGTDGAALRPIYGVYTPLGSVALTAIGSGREDGQATITVTQAIVATGSGEEAGSATLGAALALVALAAGAEVGQGALSEALAISAGGSGREVGATSLQVAQTVAGSGVGSEAGSASVSTALALVADGRGVEDGWGTVSVPATLPLPPAIGAGVEDGSASLSTALALSAGGTGAERGFATITVSQAVVASGTGLESGNSTLTLAQPLAAAGGGSESGAATLLTALATGATGRGAEVGSATTSIALALTAAGAGAEQSQATVSVATSGGGTTRATITLVAHAYPALVLAAQSRPALALTAAAYPPISLRVED